MNTILSLIGEFQAYLMLENPKMLLVFLKIFAVRLKDGRFRNTVITYQICPRHTPHASFCCQRSY